MNNVEDFLITFFVLISIISILIGIIYSIGRLFELGHFYAATYLIVMFYYLTKR